MDTITQEIKAHRHTVGRLTSEKRAIERDKDLDAFNNNIRYMLKSRPDLSLADQIHIAIDALHTLKIKLDHHYVCYNSNHELIIQQ